MIETKVCEREQLSTYYIFIIMLFPLVPFLILLVMGHYCVLTSRKSYKSLFIFQFLLAVYLGMINATKLPESDLVGYFSEFNQVRGSGFFEYMFINGKEPIFYTANYLLYYLTGGNTAIYIVILSTISYFVLFLAINKYYEKLDNRISQVMFATVLAAFFPQMFSLSAHLVRQFIASSLIMYFMVNFIFYKKNNWAVMLSAMFIHTITLLLAVFTIVATRVGRRRVVTVILMASTLAFVVWVLPGWSDMFIGKAGESFLTYPLMRASQAAVDPLENGVSLWAYLLMGLMTLILLVSDYQRTQRNIPDEKGVYHFATIYTVLFVFILMIKQRQPLLAIRCFFFSYHFIPFVIPLMFGKNSQTRDMVVAKYLLSTALIIVFFYYIKYGHWTYAPLDEVLINPLLALV